MNIDRNINQTGKGKYILINNRKIPGNLRTPQELAAAILANPECVEFGLVRDPNEFFVIKLKDRYAGRALSAYANAVDLDPEGDREYAIAVTEIANRSGLFHPQCKRPS